MDDGNDDSQGVTPPKGSMLTRRPLGGVRSLTSLSREMRLFDSRLSEMSSNAGVPGRVSAVVGYLGNLYSNWSLTQLLAKIAGSEREYCVLGSEQIDDFAFLSLKTETQRSLLREQLTCSEGEGWWANVLSHCSKEHDATIMVSLDALGFREQGLRPSNCRLGWCAGPEGLLEARVRTRRRFVWEDYVDVREFKVLGYRSGPGDMIAYSGELFLSLDNDPVVINVDKMLITWLDANSQDFGETLDCHFRLGSRPEAEAMLLAVRVFTYVASCHPPARQSSETLQDAFRSLKLCTGNSETLLKAYLDQLRTLTSEQEHPTRAVLRRRVGLEGERGSLRRTTTKNVLHGLEEEFISDTVPSEPILSFDVLAPDAGMRAAAAAAEEIANSYGVEPKRLEDRDFSPVIACILGETETKARKLPASATELGRREGFPVLTKCSLGLAVALPAVETVYIAPRLENKVSQSHLVPYGHSTGEVVARLPQILNLLRLDQNGEYMDWLLKRVKDDVTCVTTLGGVGGYDVLMRYLDGSEFSVRALYDEALEMAEGVDGKRLGTLCISALRANGAGYGSDGTALTHWLDAIGTLSKRVDRDVFLTLDAGMDLAGEQVILDKKDFLALPLQGGGWRKGKFLKFQLPGGFGQWTRRDGQDSNMCSVQKKGEDILFRGGEDTATVSVGDEDRDPQLFLRLDKLMVDNPDK